MFSEEILLHKNNSDLSDGETFPGQSEWIAFREKFFASVFIVSFLSTKCQCWTHKSSINPFETGTYFRSLES